MWWALAGAAVSAISAANAAGSSNKAAAKTSIAQNEAIIKANVANTVRTGYRVGMLNMQRGLSKRLAQQKGFDTTVLAQEALGKATANQAASGTIGASADAVSNDIRQKLGEAQAQQQEDFEVMGENFNAQLAEIVNQGQAAVEAPMKVKLQSGGDIAGNALLAGAVTFGSMYAKSKFDLGLGESSTTGRSISPGISGNMFRPTQSTMGFGSGDLGSGLRF